MRVGGGAEKGATWERQVCQSLSLWLTHGQRADILTRNVLSGGVFTAAVKREELERGQPGDVMAAHPLAFKFIQTFLVECKHLASLDMDNFIWDGKNKSPLAKIWQLACEQAEQAEEPLKPMLIAKQNHRPALVFLRSPTFELFNVHTRLGIALRHHDFHRRSVSCCLFDDMLNYVDPHPVLAQFAVSPRRAA